MAKFNNIIFVSILSCGCASAQSQQNHLQLLIQVRPELAVAWQRDAIVVKARLGPGARASVWAGASCDVHSVAAYIIASSGTHTIPLSVIESDHKVNVCISSSDGTIATYPAPDM